MLQVITLLAVALLVAIDQIIKLLVLEHLKPIGSFPLIDDVLQLRYIENTGAAFGSFSEQTKSLSIFTFIVIVIGFAYLFLRRRKLDVEYVCISVILAGGIGNLVDRIYRGFVVDYIEPLFVDFAVFNFADILVTCSSVVLIIWMIYDVYREIKEKKRNMDNE